MKALISRFGNSLHNHDKLSKISFMDINKIKEFQKSGNIFGLLLTRQDSVIDKILEAHGIVADFRIQEDGSIYFKEGYQYFDYEPFEKEEIEMILSSLVGNFTVRLTTPKEEIHYHNNEDLNNDQIYTRIVIENGNQNKLMEQLKQYVDKMINLSVQENEIWIFSKKSSLDKSVDVLCGIKNIMIHDVCMLADYYHDFELTNSIDNLYALKEDNEIDKDVYIVDSIGECLDDILEEDSSSPFLSEKIY